MNRSIIALAGAICGVAWWGLSTLLGADAATIVGTQRWIGPAAGAVTGIAIAFLSIPIYRRFSKKALLWFSPLSVYLAITIYGFVIFALRSAVDDFPAGSIRWAVGMQSVVAMWWGVTVLLPIAVAVHAPAYLNHRILRSLLTTASSPAPL